jgi:hypothetical protein
MKIKKVIGLFLVIVSAAFYIIYPTGNDMTLIAYLTIMWDSALFGGAISVYSIYDESNKGKK